MKTGAQANTEPRSHVTKQIESKATVEQQPLYKKLKSKAQSTYNDSAISNKQPSNFGSPSYLSSSLQKEALKLQSTIQKLKENIQNHHNQSIQKQSLSVIQEAKGKTTKQEPIKASREILPALELTALEKPNKFQLVQKQIVYERTDSVRSNATAYTTYGQNKVVKLIRYENNNNSCNHGMMDTNRSQAINSAIKGIANQDQQSFVRKIQTPQVFKGKQKMTKRSSKLQNTYQSTLSQMNSSDFNPFVQSVNSDSKRMQLNNPFQQTQQKTLHSQLQQQSPVASRFIYSEKKCSDRNPQGIVSTDFVQVHIDDGDELCMAVNAENGIPTEAVVHTEQNVDENKLNFSFAESIGGGLPTEGNQNDSFSGKNTKAFFTQTNTEVIKSENLNSEYYTGPKTLTSEPPKIKKKEDDVLRKYGIQKIVPSSNRSSNLRQQTNQSRGTERSANTQYSIGGTKREQAPMKGRGGKNEMAAVKPKSTISNNSKMSNSYQGQIINQQLGSGTTIPQSARVESNQFGQNPFAQTQKEIYPNNNAAFNPFKQQTQKPIYGSISPERKRKNQFKEQQQPFNYGKATQGISNKAKPGNQYY